MIHASKIKLSLLILGIFVVFAFFSTPTTATEDTEDATLSAQEETVRENIKNRIEQVIEENGVAEKEIKVKKAIVGKVERVTSEALTLKTMQGIQTVKLDAEKSIVLQLPKLEQLTIADIAIDGDVVVMGFLKEDMLEAKRILVSSSPLLPQEKKVDTGIVRSITATNITYVNRNNEEVETPLEKATEYKGADGKKIKRTGVKKDDNILIMSLTPEDASASAALVRILPEKE